MEIAFSLKRILAALFKMAKTWKEPQFLKARNWLSKQLHIYSVIILQLLITMFKKVPENVYKSTEDKL